MYWSNYLLVTSSWSKHRQTFVHKAKNNEMSRWASCNDIEVFLTNGCALLTESFSEVPGSETWEPLVDVSWLSTWKEIHRRKKSETKTKRKKVPFSQWPKQLLLNYINPKIHSLGSKCLAGLMIKIYHINQPFRVFLRKKKGKIQKPPQRFGLIPCISVTFLKYAIFFLHTNDT